MDSSDEIAIKRARRGDQDAFRILVERHARTVFRLAWRMTTDQTDAEDIVQETFLKAWKQIAKFDDRAAFGTWLHRICLNCSFDVLRHRQSSRLVSVREDLQDPMEQMPADSPSPERLAQSAQISAALIPAMNELSEMERAAFVLRHYEGVSVEEIAKTLGVAPGAARHSVFRAVQKLRRALEPMAVVK